MTFKITVLILLTVVFLYELLIRFIRWRSEKNPIPENVADVYDPETYRTWRAYWGEKNKVGILSHVVTYVTDLILLAANAYAAFAGLFPDSGFWQLFAVLLLSVLGGLTTLPFTWYDTMKVEEKYGFNRSTKKTFWLDQVKQLLISLGLLVGIGCFLMGVHQSIGDWLILVFAVGMTVVALGFAFLYPFFSKIFNKFTPLEEGELRDSLTALLEKNGYKVRAIQVMDASRRTTKSNAYFAGFGKMKTIVLYDTLVQAMTPREICAVFAHEMGHGLHKDTLKNQLLTFAQMAILAVLAWLTLRYPGVFTAFGFDGVNYGFAIVLIMSVEFALIAPLFLLLSSFFSRKAEYRADAKAVEEGYGEELISGLKTLSRQNFSDLAPSPILVKLTYSHPTLSQRITAIRALEEKK